MIGLGGLYNEMSSESRGPGLTSAHLTRNWPSQENLISDQ